MLSPGTRVIAKNVRVVTAFNDDRPVYGRADLRGRIAQRDSKRFVGWGPPKEVGGMPTIVWEPGPQLPARDQTGCYWLETDTKARYLVHERDIQRDYSPVFVRVGMEEAAV